MCADRRDIPGNLNLSMSNPKRTERSWPPRTLVGAFLATNPFDSVFGLPIHLNRMSGTS